MFNFFYAAEAKEPGWVFGCPKDQWRSSAQRRPNLNRSYNASLPLLETTVLLAPQLYQHRGVPETEEFDCVGCYICQ